MPRTNEAAWANSAAAAAATVDGRSHDQERQPNADDHLDRGLLIEHPAKRADAFQRRCQGPRPKSRRNPAAIQSGLRTPCRTASALPEFAKCGTWNRAGLLRCISSSSSNVRSRLPSLTKRKSTRSGAASKVQEAGAAGRAARPRCNREPRSRPATFGHPCPEERRAPADACTASPARHELRIWSRRISVSLGRDKISRTGGETMGKVAGNDLPQRTRRTQREEKWGSWRSVKGTKGSKVRRV